MQNEGIFLKDNKAKKFIEEKADKKIWDKIAKQSKKFRQNCAN